MIDTALAHLYAMPPLAATLSATVAMLWGGSIAFGLLDIVAQALDRPEVLRWTVRRCHAVRQLWRRWRYGALYAAPRIERRRVEQW